MESVTACCSGVGCVCEYTKMDSPVRLTACSYLIHRSINSTPRAGCRISMSTHALQANRLGQNGSSKIMLTPRFERLSQQTLLRTTAMSSSPYAPRFLLFPSSLIVFGDIAWHRHLPHTLHHLTSHLVTLDP